MEQEMFQQAPQVNVIFYGHPPIKTKSFIRTKEKTGKQERFLLLMHAANNPLHSFQIREN